MPLVKNDTTQRTMQRVIYFGPPGSGKTTTLLRHLEQALEDGVPPERIAFLTFTRKARREALERVEHTLGKSPKELPYFRTIHSMAYRALKLQDGDILGTVELKEFGASMGLSFGKTALDEQASEGINSGNLGDYLMAVDTLSRLRGQTPKTIWSSLPAAETPCEWAVVDHYIKSYRAFKEDRGLLDFTDVLEEFVRSNIELPVDIAFIDEAQDLSALQWYVTLKAVKLAKLQYVGGDDDQSIFQWAGADVEFFQKLEGAQTVLSHSYRLPRIVHANALRILQRIKHRVPKKFDPRDAPGSLHRHAGLQGLSVKAGEQWLWLVRNRYLMGALRERLEQDGIVYSSQHGQPSIVDSERDAIYTWERLRTGLTVSVVDARDLYAKLRTREQVKHGFKALPGVDDHDQVALKGLTEKHGLLVNPLLPWYEVLGTIPIPRRAYYRKLLRTHRTLKLPIQVVVETIHGAKGGEAPNVALFLDRSRRVAVEEQKDPDPEHRVWYVGATRAREALHLVEGSSQHAYTMPRNTGV